MIEIQLHAIYCKNANNKIDIVNKHYSVFNNFDTRYY